MKWRYTNIQHEPRIALGLSLNEYTVLDIFYKSQTHPDYGMNGWAKVSYTDMANFIGLSKAAIHKIVCRMEQLGLIEVNPIDPKLKQVTGDFYNLAYEQQLTEDHIPIVQKVNVQKVNGNVQKVNDSRSKSERKRSKSERQIEYKEKKEENKGGEGSATRTTATSKGFAYLGEMADRLTPLLESGQVDIRAAFSAAGIEPTVPQIRQHIAEWWSYCQQQNTRVARADEYAQWRHFRDRWVPNITSPTIRRKAGDKEPRRTFDNEYYAQFENEL